MRYHIITFGCQMNKSDSERISAVFEHLNCSAVDSIEEADYVVVNACSVRQKGIDRIWGLVDKVRRIARKNRPKVILTGCLLLGDKKKFKESVDFVFNINNLLELEKYVSKQIVYTSENYFDVLPKTSSSYFAFIPIITGCNNYCSYCAVPYVRGREESRKIKEVLNEIKILVKQGCKAIELLGQNVNSYLPGDQSSFFKKNPYQHNFAKLLWEVNHIKGLKRVHFSSSHPKDMDDEVIDALKLPKQVNYLHLAVQSGDKEVLKKMNRKYTVKEFEAIIKKVRKIKPEIAIGTDIIVGFPGETDKQFENTLKFYKKMRFDISYHARYSERVGTAAAKLEDNVTREEKKKRWRRLQTLMEKITLEKNQIYLNKEISVLIDVCTKDYCEGNSMEMKRARIYRRKHLPGDIVRAKVTKAMTWMLECR
jgi:tRNA-2-methylthio-N6-dimethylallyladenosine synthase